MSHSSRIPRIFLGSVFLLLGVLFLFIGGNAFLEEERYQQQGVRAEAVTTAKALRRATADSETSYEISYRFSVAGGSSHEQTESVPVHLWESVDEGSPLAVEYVPGEPASARAVRDGSEDKVTAVVMLSVGGVLALIGLVVLKGAFSRRHARDQASVAADTAKAESTPSTPGPPSGAASNAGSFWPLARRSFGFWFGGIFLLCGVPFLLTSIFLFYNDWQFAQEAVSTQGMVLTKEIRVSRSSGRGSSRSSRREPTKHYEATYRFTVDAETIEGRDELSHDLWQQLAEREPVEVLYRPGKTSSNRLAGHSSWLLKTIFGLLGAVFTVLGGVFFTRAVGSARLESRLRQQGVRAQGAVTELHERNVKLNDMQQWRLHYEYRDFQGQRHTSTTDMLEDEAEQWKVGDTGVVLYDPSRPAEAVWLGKGP